MFSSPGKVKLDSWDLEAIRGHPRSAIFLTISFYRKIIGLLKKFVVFASLMYVHTSIIMVANLTSPLPTLAKLAHTVAASYIIFLERLPNGYALYRNDRMRRHRAWLSQKWLVLIHTYDTHVYVSTYMAILVEVNMKNEITKTIYYGRIRVRMGRIED